MIIGGNHQIFLDAEALILVQEVKSESIVLQLRLRWSSVAISGSESPCVSLHGRQIHDFDEMRKASDTVTKRSMCMRKLAYCGATTEGAEQIIERSPAKSERAETCRSSCGICTSSTRSRLLR